MALARLSEIPGAVSVCDLAQRYGYTAQGLRQRARIRCQRGLIKQHRVRQIDSIGRQGQAFVYTIPGRTAVEWSAFDDIFIGNLSTVSPKFQRTDQLVLVNKPTSVVEYQRLWKCSHHTAEVRINKLQHDGYLHGGGQTTAINKRRMCKLYTPTKKGLILCGE